MAFNVSVHNSCKIVTVRAKAYTGASTADIVFTDLNSGAVYTSTVTYSAGLAQQNVPVANLPAANGAYKVCLKEGGVEQACRALLINCDIDCCLAKLTNELIECACDCPKCASALAKAQKIFLLLQSAISSVGLTYTSSGGFNSGYYQDILSKYLKAKELCDNSCGCDC